MKSKNGFTLIELIVVVAIIGLLSMIAVPTLMEYQRKASDAAARADAVAGLTTILAATGNN